MSAENEIEIHQASVIQWSARPYVRVAIISVPSARIPFKFSCCIPWQCARAFFFTFWKKKKHILALLGYASRAFMHRSVSLPNVGISFKFLLPNFRPKRNQMFRFRGHLWPRIGQSHSFTGHSVHLHFFLKIRLSMVLPMLLNLHVWIF